MRILVAEDDPDLGERVRTSLREAGYAADVATDGEEADYLGREEPYDAVILDLGLPQRAGLTVLANWRREGNPVPVLVLTARNAWYERVEGFEAGADDYLGKPFHMEELLARLGALLRRRHGRPGGPLEVAGLTLDEAAQTVRTPDGTTNALTATEFRLLRYFMLNPGRVLSKAALSEHLYEYDADKDSNVLEVYVRRLRAKIGKERIATRRGQGYLLRADGP
ncbi:transcriptional regulator [Thiohalorhabdus denitrificans]|uniref:DNA-binding response regulator, OmpR family, contains REC and winged-helix (WHTH) domain n=1 Tax=Thiohalorhabdus denitrificans TaxID=381306 RepID=A0A0P9C648_9GAMM|nr:response regulator transcription factor [Thiohalorhabdus denitrificans]KPV40312.1 transcriptional regulator [Thiohalorhabdus denitrificans]SCX80347.1 DNA-binding response regulator, OmpR family, contains REC and winged-helix (wHTH) domain [Thiohalorhabdus denitrificans]